MGIVDKQILPWWRSKYVLWSFLMFPGLMFTIGLLRDAMSYSNLMHATGEFSARFLVFSLIATPLLMLFPRAKFPKWLNRNKRYFGIAAFAYGFYHTVAYLVEVPVSEVLASFFEIGMVTSWVALIIWIPMAITSTDGWVLRLKKTWKKIHNWGYLAALMVFLHWVFIHYNWKPALVHALPVFFLQGYRWWNVFYKRNL